MSKDLVRILQRGATVGLIAFIFLFIVWLMVGGNSYEFTDTITYTINSGDTLWTIARYYSCANCHNIQNVISIIRDINNITPQIFPNQQIEIPVFELCR